MREQIEHLKGISPGKFLSHELKKRKLTQRDMSASVGMHYQTLNSIIAGKRQLTIPTALRIEKYLNLEEGFLLMLQTYYQIEREKKKMAETTPAFPPIRKVVFWDTDMGKLDWTKNKDAIIARVNARGNKQEIQAIKNFYGQNNDKE